MVKIATEGEFLRLWRRQTPEWKELEGDSASLKTLSEAFLGKDQVTSPLSANDLAKRLCRGRLPKLWTIARAASLVHGASSPGRIPSLDEDQPRKCYRSLVSALIRVFSNFPLRELLTWHGRECHEEQKTAVRHAFRERLSGLCDNGNLKITLDDKTYSGQRDQGPVPLARENLEALADVILEFHKENPSGSITLHLEDCGFGDEHLGAILCLMQEGALHRLELPKNALTPEGLSTLSEAINACTSLNHVDLSQTKHLSADLGKFISQIGQRTTLYEVNLSGCFTSEEDKKSIEASQSEPFPALVVQLD